ncbi:MAG: hypothetical protein ACOX50_00475 [Patescibacteria group bacterium]
MSDFSAQENNKLCKSLLEEKGFLHLTDLLNKEKETEFFKTVKKYSLEKALNTRIPQPELFKKYKVKVTVIPSFKLKVVCAPESKEIKITPLGKYLKALYANLEKNNIEGTLFLTAGGAMETLGTRPPNKSKLNKNTITMKDYCPDSGSPKLDGDIVFFTNDPYLDEEKVVNLMTKEEKNSSLKLKIITSKSRPFTRIDIGKIFSSCIAQDYQWDKYWESYGHIALPEFKARHSSSVSFIQSLMGWEDSSPYILLVPSRDKAGFIGAYINFFPRQQLYKDITYWKKDKLYSLKPTVINWFEIMFPFEQSPQEALTHLIFHLKSSTWNDKISFINFDNNSKLGKTLTKLSQSRKGKIKDFSAKTSQYFAQKIIYPIAKSPEIIICDNSSMYQWTSRLVKTMKGIINGDPYLGLVYLLAADVNPTDAPVYGIGIIDPKGFFPKLYEFLHQGDRLERLIGLMAETEEGPAMKGWPTFLNFIYSETGFDVKKTAKLLNPNFCSMEIYPTLVEEFILPDLQKTTLPLESLSEAPLVST